MLTDAGIAEYRTNGYVLVESVFSDAEVAAIRAAIPEATVGPPHLRLLESDNKTLRTAYAIHAISPRFAALARQARFVEPARALLEDDVCVFQSKLSMKAALRSGIFHWHQDFAFWHGRDGLPQPQAMNAVVFMDEVSYASGPLFVLPGSHHRGLLPAKNFMLELRTMRELAESYELVPLLGGAGACLFFHPNLVHGSPNNISPHDRALAFITYNAISNRMPVDGERSPEYLASHDYRPIVHTEGPGELLATTADSRLGASGDS